MRILKTSFMLTVYFFAIHSTVSLVASDSDSNNESSIEQTDNQDNKELFLQIACQMKNLQDKIKVLEKQAKEDSTKRLNESKGIIKDSLKFIEHVLELSGDEILSFSEDLFSSITDKLKKYIAEKKEEVLKPGQIDEIQLSFFREIKQKTTKLQQLTPIVSNNKKMIATALWITTMINPPISVGIILSYPLFYLVSSQYFIMQKSKKIKIIYEFITKKPKRKDTATIGDLNEILTHIKNNTYQDNIIEAFEKEEQDIINDFVVSENDVKLEVHRDILINFDFEQRLYNYYTTWFSRRMMIQLLFMTLLSSSSWIVAKKN